MLDWEDKEFYEESQYTEEIENLREAIRNSVKKGILDEMNRLKTENEKLQGIKEHFDEVKREYERKKAQCDIAIATAEENARRARLEEILEDHRMIRWKVESRYGYGPKCDKCDKNRKIQIKLPSGRVVDDNCKCEANKRFYYPVSYEMYEISDRRGLIAHYQKKDSGNDIYYAVEICDERMKDRIEEWKKRKTEESVRGLLFDSREECQSACDIFNEKQGHPEWIYRLDGELLENGKCEK